jgi:hypothetical protein
MLRYSWLLLLPTLAFAGETNVTIYSTATPGSVSPEMYRPTPASANNGWGYNAQIPGYAIVREQREVELKAGVNQISFADVAAFIEPTTVSFKSLTDPTGTYVLEQNYNFDLVNAQKLIEKFIGQEITVEQNVGNSIQSNVGKLLSASGGLILQDKSNKVTSLNGYSNIKFPELPNGLITKPTLLWSLSAKKDGKHNVETSYQTTGLTWWADYIATYEDGENANKGFLDLASWVSIINKAGATFNDAKLKLVAGDVNRAQPNVARGREAMMMKASMAMEDSGFEEKSFFEYHLYTLGRKVSIPDNSTKQLELFPKAIKIPVTKEYLYYGAAQPYYGYTYMDRGGELSNSKVEVFLKFKNSDKENLGVPLPSGRIRVNQVDKADGSMEFIGEDIIDHTPKDEKVTIKLGNAFDIVGERKQVDFKVDNARKMMEESIEITLRNHKKDDVTITVKENLYRGSNWKISDNSDKFEKENANTIYFNIPVKKDGESKVKYKVVYTW